MAAEKAIAVEVTYNVPTKDDLLQIPFTRTLDITVKAVSAGVEEVKLPERFTLSNGWKEQSRSLGLRERDFWQQKVSLVALAPGQLSLQPQPLRYRLAGDKTWKTHPLPAVNVAVTTTLSDADPKSLRDITAIETLPVVESSRALWWLLIGLASMVGLAGAIVVWRRRAKAGESPAPANWSLHQLNRLQALDLPAKGQTIRFHHLLANIVRAYVEKRFGMPARRLTNPEFMQKLDLASCFSADQKSILRRVLDQCDQARFSRQRTSMDTSGQALEMARALITESAARKPEAGEK